MKLSRLFTVVVVGTALMVSCGYETQPVPSKLKMALGGITDQYIVVFKGNVGNPSATAKALAAAHGAKVKHTYGTAIKGFAAQMSATAAAALANNPNVAYVEQDQVAAANAVTWGIDRIDQRSLPLDGSYAPAGGATGAGVTAYIIDTGIRPTHAEFGGRASVAADTVGDGNNGIDCAGHGTHVAGTVGGATYGVAPGVTIKAVRVLDCGGSGSWSGVIAGMDWVAANAQHPAVANMSLGGGYSQAVNAAAAGMVAAGVVTAVAAGNEGKPGGRQGDACDHSPAAEPSVMSIGASDNTDTRPYWSNWGDCVDFFAPGVGITSSWIDSDTDTNTISGTSMASPHVAGAAALVLQSNPGWSHAQVQAQLEAQLTPNAVSSSRSTNNGLLFVGTDGPPPPAPVCGDGNVDSGEDCDGSNLGGATCTSQGFASGSLACDGSCAFDTSACVAAACGNNTTEGSEVCDGSDLNSRSCTDFAGYTGGTLGCLSNCSGYDFSGCVEASCLATDADCTADADCCSGNCAARGKSGKFRCR